MATDGFMSRAQGAFAYVGSVLKNRYFWGGLAAFLVLGLALYVLLNYLVLPAYTRHDAALTVPEVINQPFEQAAQELRARDLQVERVVQRFNPNLPRDVVVDQNPRAQALVKPGRKVFLTVNSGRQAMVKVPSLEGLSLREAENRLIALGLRVEETRPDTIPHPHQNTVTRQRPAAGDSLAQGASVVLWYSTGLGNEYATVPDVTGLTVQEAQQLLIENKLRSVIIGAREQEQDEELTEQIVQRQSREPGTRVPEGFEIRLYLGDEEPAAPPEELVEQEDA